MRYASPILATLLLLTPIATADTIHVHGTTHKNVFVQQTTNQYLILFPQSGSVLAIPNDAIAPHDLQITQDPAQRKALRTTWRNNARTQRDKKSPPITPSTKPTLPRFNHNPLPNHIQEAESYLDHNGVRTIVLKGTPPDPATRQAREEQRRAAQKAWDAEVQHRQRIAQEQRAAQYAAQQAAERQAAQRAYQQQQWALNLQRQQLQNEQQWLRNQRLRQQAYFPYNTPTIYTTGHGPWRNTFHTYGQTHTAIIAAPGINTTIIHNGRTRTPRRTHPTPSHTQQPQTPHSPPRMHHRTTPLTS